MNEGILIERRGWSLITGKMDGCLVAHKGDSMSSTLYINGLYTSVGEPELTGMCAQLGECLFGQHLQA